ncbi:hypothetical protein [Wenyingzhuangia sp. IMCC45574]
MENLKLELNIHKARYALLFNKFKYASVIQSNKEVARLKKHNQKHHFTLEITNHEKLILETDSISHFEFTIHIENKLRKWKYFLNSPLEIMKFSKKYCFENFTVIENTSQMKIYDNERIIGFVYKKPFMKNGYETKFENSENKIEMMILLCVLAIKNEFYDYED